MADFYNFVRCQHSFKYLQTAQPEEIRVREAMELS